MSCSFDVYGGCVQLGTTPLYVTGQPSTDAYQEIGAAGVLWVVCVRNPNETAEPPFQNGEAADLLLFNALYVNVPVTHDESQETFNDAATAAAIAMLGVLRQGPALIHCSTGDRASAVVAVALIATGIASNAEAEAFAVEKLLLRKDEIKQYVLHYQVPDWFPELLAGGMLEASALKPA
jgi:protein tyrosine phosphatase (PTP) superfamily phosphohydrolase (DUF442 family)